VYKSTKPGDSRQTPADRRGQRYGNSMHVRKGPKIAAAGRRKRDGQEGGEEERVAMGERGKGRQKWG
jgi:hypothetical protein